MIQEVVGDTFHTDIYITKYNRTIVNTVHSYETLKSDRGLDLVLRNTPRSPKDTLLTCEDYCKWYDLFTVNGSNEVASVHENSNAAYHDLEWWDHAPIPRSVIRCCITEGWRIDIVSYLAICYRFAEDALECEPYEIDKEYLATPEELKTVLICQIIGTSSYFGLPWLVISVTLRHIFGDSDLIDIFMKIYGG